METSKPNQPDWERIEALYRAGVMSTREIAAEVGGISHTAINKRAKKEEWPRDLSAKVKAKADALVSKQTVSSEVASRKAATEKQVVEIEAQVQARIRISHRKDISRNRDLLRKLVDELEQQTDNMELLRQLGEIMYAPDEKGRDKLNEVYQAVISLPERTKTMKALGETLKVLIGLEREAFGLDERAPATEAGALGALLGQLNRSSVPVVAAPPADDE